MPGQFRNYDPYAYTPADVQGLGAGTWATNALSGAASGAATGAHFGPWGAAVGGVIGGVVGLGSTAAAQKASIAAQEQQNALNAQLADRGVFNQMIQGYGLQSQAAAERAVSDARATAARMGLSPEAAAGLEQQARHDAASATAAGLPGVYSAAQQMELARQYQVGQNFQVAQGLANNAAAPNYGQMWGSTLQAVGAFAGARDAAKAAKAPMPGTAGVGGTPDGLLPTTDEGAAIAQQATQQAQNAEWGQLSANPWSTQSAFYGASPTAPVSSTERAAIGGLPSYAAPAAAAPTAGAAPVSAASKAPTSRAGAGAAPRQGPGARPAYSPATGGPAGGYPPGALGANIHPDTYAAVSRGDNDFLLNRVPATLAIPDYSAWAASASESGLDAAHITPDMYARWLTTAYQ